MENQSDDPTTISPQNAAFEIRKAYNYVIETGVMFFWDRREISDVIPAEVKRYYERAMTSFHGGNRLAAERWARACKHLSRAFGHESKIAYFQPRVSEIPALEEPINRDDTEDQLAITNDLLESLATHVPPGMKTKPHEMLRYLALGRRHLTEIKAPGRMPPFLRAERIWAAYEYARVLECISLAYEAEHQKTKAA